MTQPPPLFVAVKANPKDKAARQVEADREQGQEFKVRHQFKLLISDVFQQYEPQMLDKLDHFLDKYKGQEQFLYLAVCEKFNVEPRVKVQITKKEEKLPVLDSDRPNLVGEQGPDMKPKLSVTDTEASTGHISEATCSDESEGEHSPAQRVNRDPDAAIQNVPAAWRRPPPGLFSAAGSAAVPKRGRSPPRGQSPPTAPPTVPPTAPPTGPPTAPPTAPPSATPKPWRSTIAEPAVGTAKLPTPPAGTDVGRRPDPVEDAAEDEALLEGEPLRAEGRDGQHSRADATNHPCGAGPLRLCAGETTNCCLVMRDGLLQDRLVDFPQQPVACQPPHDPPRGLTTRGAERGPR
ncbi:unnamed protein product [Prorocentrum cordatum]|uniref:Uncharacterized protein n=1 Tax=Prorocentrum cordatum TaxID=2364126 RepID=A0ABN9UUU3_9DINO|nr:unnamed protein product [Polarella glacialis]